MFFDQLGSNQGYGKGHANRGIVQEYAYVLRFNQELKCQTLPTDTMTGRHIKEQGR
jgi:hypothetical protein